jgi:hypothetical protein
VLPEAILDQMVKVKDLAYVQSARADPCPADAPLEVTAAFRIPDRLYVALENTTLLEKEEEIMTSTNLGRVKKVSLLPVFAH